MHRLRVRPRTRPADLHHARGRRADALPDRRHRHRLPHHLRTRASTRRRCGRRAATGSPSPTRPAADVLHRRDPARRHRRAQADRHPTRTRARPGRRTDVSSPSRAKPDAAPDRSCGPSTSPACICAGMPTPGDATRPGLESDPQIGSALDLVGDTRSRTIPRPCSGRDRGITPGIEYHFACVASGELNSAGACCIRRNTSQVAVLT